MMSEQESKPEHDGTGSLDAQGTLLPTARVKKLCERCYSYIHQKVIRCTEEYGVRHVVKEVNERCECGCGCTRTEQV